MFQQLSKWYSDLEQEQLDILERPELAAQARPGYRRCCALKLAKLSPIERQQLHAFSVRYRGRLLFSALAKWMLAFSAIGLLVHLLWPGTAGLPAVILLANVLGVAMLWMCVAAYFSYRDMMSLSLRKIALFLVLTIGLAVLGSTGGALLRGVPIMEALRVHSGGAVFVSILMVVVLCIPIGVISVLRNRQYLALMAQLQHDAERERLAREVSEARLRMLRAQIEPHFLFNTLGAVQQLAEQGAPRAAQLTANLIAFLRASLAEMRSEQVSLHAEFGLVDAYLQVMKVRLGERLRFSLALPAALEQVTIPGMMVLTLVENAIKHGIEPALRGGEIQVSAQESAGMLRLLVQDSGAGLGGSPGKGFGMENVRTRLELLYGSAAGVSLADHADGGAAAAITLPMQRKG